MGLTVVYAKIAQKDLSEIYNYIRKDSLHYARNEVRLIGAAVRKLGSNPFLHKKFEKSNDEFTKELIFRNYRIVYDIVPNTKMIILSIHHHARSLTNNPAFTDED